VTLTGEQFKADDSINKTRKERERKFKLGGLPADKVRKLDAYREKYD